MNNEENMFTRCWVDAKKYPPDGSERYWCVVRELNSLGYSHYQANCSYDPRTKEWRENIRGDALDVIYWTELAPMPVPEVTSTQYFVIENYNLTPNKLSKNKGVKMGIPVPYVKYWLAKGLYGVERVKRVQARRKKRYAKKRIKTAFRYNQRKYFDDIDGW